MTVWEVFAEYDKNATIMNDQELEVWLNETLSAFQQEHPDDYFGQSAILNELGGFYRSRESLTRASRLSCLRKTCMSLYRTSRALIMRRRSTIWPGFTGLPGIWTGLLRCSMRRRSSTKPVKKRPRPSSYASCLNNKGLVYQDMKRYEEARELFEKALALINDLPNNGYVLATTLSNLAFALHGLGEKDKVALYLDQAIEIFCQEMGEQSPLYQSCLKVREKLLGE